MTIVGPRFVAFLSAALALGLAAPPGVASATADETATLAAATEAGLVGIAEAVLRQRTAAMLPDSAAAALNEPLANTLAKASESLTATQAAAVTELHARRDALAEWGEAYTAGETGIRGHQLTVNGKTAVLDVEEFTKLYYAKVTGLEPEFTAFAAHRRFVFAREADGGWVLESESRLEDGPAPINEATGAQPAEMKAALAAEPETGAAADPKRVSAQDATVQYNYGAMAAYAETYWDNYNSGYRTFSDVGGDCTNFVSQVMRAGGWSDASGYYRDAHYWWYNFLNQTWSWINVNYWHDFAAVYSGRTYILGSPDYMGLADVLQVDFTYNGSKDHSMVVSYNGSQPYLTYHTTDTYRRSLSSLKSSYPSARWVPHRT